MRMIAVRRSQHRSTGWAAVATVC